MKDAVAANRLAGSMEDLVRAATRFFTEMTTEQPVFLPIVACISMSCFCPCA
jgi:hypothetical protein